MAKKNTLSDLNAFLKSQSPQESAPTQGEPEFLKSKTTVLAKIEKKSQWDNPSLHAAAELAAQNLRQLAQKEGLSSHQLLIASAIVELESREDLKASDLMLLNTLLYVQHVEK